MLLYIWYQIIYSDNIISLEPKLKSNWIWSPEALSAHVFLNDEPIVLEALILTQMRRQF